MKLILKLGLILLILIGAGFFISEKTKPEVMIEAVEKGTATHEISANVTVLPSVEIIEKSLEQGRVVESIFIPGSGSLSVEKGDVLCRLDTETLDYEINKTKNQLSAAQKRIATGSAYELDLENAVQDYEHNKKLNEMQQFPDSELKKQERHIEKLKRMIEVENIDRETNLKHQEENLTQLLARREKMTIRASITGVISESYILTGNYVYPGNPVAKIISVTHLVQVSISEEDYPGIQLGQKASVKFLGIKNRTFSGTISNVVATANASTKRRLAFVTLDHTPADLLVPGMTGEAKIVKDRRDNTLLIPRKALVGKYVFVLNGNKVELREVKSGYRGLNTVEILEGLDENDSIVVNNLQQLRDGDRVKLKKSTH